MLLKYLINACKYTREGSIHVNVNICSEGDLPRGCKVNAADLKVAEFVMNNGQKKICKDNNGDMENAEYLLFQVVDTGFGVNPEQLDSMFEVFSQTCFRGQKSGTGLGLFSVYSRCKRLGGACGVISPNESADIIGHGNGSTFWFRIPYVPVSEQHVKLCDFNNCYPTDHLPCSLGYPCGKVVMGIQMHQEGEQLVNSTLLNTLPRYNPEEGDPEKNHSMSYSAFVVDDIPSIRKLLARTLHNLGFSQVTLFENGKRALDAMKKEMVDVVFMDMQVTICDLPPHDITIAIHNMAHFISQYCQQMPIMSGPEVGLC